MTGLATNSEYLKQSYLLNKRSGEPQAFELLRSFGQKFLETQNWPTRKDENWKYTPTQIFSTQQFALTSAQPQTIDEVTKKSIYENTNASAFTNSFNIVFVNGIYQPNFSKQTLRIQTTAQPNAAADTDANSEVRVLSLKNAIEKGLYPIFDLSKPQNAFEALNLSLLEEGVFIDVPAQFDFKPILNLSFISTPTEKQSVTLPRVILKLGTGAKFTLFENYESLGNSSNTSNGSNSGNNSNSGSVPTQWTNSQVEIHLESKSQLTWARLQNENETQLHTCRTKIYLAEGTELHSLLLSEGANLHRHDLQIEVNGENASAKVHGISLGTNKEHRDHNTLINFKSGNSTAEQIFKSILHGESKSIFNGKIIIQQDSQKVDSSQLNQSLILSEKAEANSQPQLEIYADDVKATHGATVGQLNEDELFYFKSRGISEIKAKLMMTQGFAVDLVDRFPNEEIKSLLKKKIETKLQGFW
jgi:Fe-S cluster assembly protein SufD